MNKGLGDSESGDANDRFTERMAQNKMPRISQPEHIEQLSEAHLECLSARTSVT